MLSCRVWLPPSPRCARRSATPRSSRPAMRGRRLATRPPANSLANSYSAPATSLGNRHKTPLALAIRIITLDEEPYEQLTLPHRNVRPDGPRQNGYCEG